MLKPETKKRKQTLSDGRHRARAARPEAASGVKENSPTREQIAERAYFIWLDKGRPREQDVACWCEAEVELRARRPGIGDKADKA